MIKKLLGVFGLFCFTSNFSYAADLVSIGDLVEEIYQEVSPKDCPSAMRSAADLQKEKLSIPSLENDVARYEKKIKPNDVEGMKKLSSLHYQLGLLLAQDLENPRHALEHLDRFLSLETFVWEFSDQKQIQQAVSTICLAELFYRNYKNDDQNTRHQLEQKLRLPWSLKENKNILKNFIRHYPYSLLGRLLLAKWYLNRNQESQAYPLLTQAIEYAPTCILCHQWLTGILGKIGKREEARQHCWKAFWYNNFLRHESENDAVLTSCKKLAVQ